jgi:hypothetical protein
MIFSMLYERITPTFVYAIYNEAWNMYMMY